MIFIGAGVNKDEEKGLRWLKKLAQEGNKDAMEYLKDI
jgi:TPR repeat protein